jgi:hypothetical protein
MASDQHKPWLEKSGAVKTIGRDEEALRIKPDYAKDENKLERQRAA